MEGGVIAIKQILSMTHTHKSSFYSGGPHMQSIRSDLPKQILSVHTGAQFQSVGFTAISLRPQIGVFFHTIFQLKSPESSVYHTVSCVCVYVQTSTLHIFHTVYCYVSAAKPQTIFDYIMLRFHTISEMSCKLQSRTVAAEWMCMFGITSC